MFMVIGHLMQFESAAGGAGSGLAVQAWFGDSGVQGPGGVS
jgi:hypothetical protein